MKNTLRPEQIGNAYILEVDYNGRSLTGIAERLTSPYSFRVWMPGVCNLAISQNYQGDWSIDSGAQIAEALVQCIGDHLDTFSN